MDFTELCDLITELSDITTDNIYMDSQLNNDLGLRSCDIMTLIAMIESKTGKEINILGLNGKITVGYLLDYINM